MENSSALPFTFCKCSGFIFYPIIYCMNLNYQSTRDSGPLVIKRAGIPELQTDCLVFNMVKNAWPEGF